MPNELITVESIVRDKLKEMGANGLCYPESDCGCGVDDLAPCGEMQSECRPAWKRTCLTCKLPAYFPTPNVGAWRCGYCAEADHAE